jgi:hypothetical protein
MDNSTPLFVQTLKTKRTVGSGSAHGPGFFFRRCYLCRNRESRRQTEVAAPPPELRSGFPKCLIMQRLFQHKTLSQVSNSITGSDFPSQVFSLLSKMAC